MTKEEKIIATAYTGIMFIEGSDMGLLYEYMEKKVGYKVFDLFLADTKFWEKLRKACEQDFIDMISKDQPSLPSNLFEAKLAFSEERFPDEKMAPLRRAARIGYEAGAQWQKEQMLKEAVEGEVVKDINNKLAVTAKNVNLDKFKFGDKVRVIIIKE